MHEDRRKLQDLDFGGEWQNKMVKQCGSVCNQQFLRRANLNSKLGVGYSSVLNLIQSWQKALAQRCTLVWRMGTLTPACRLHVDTSSLWYLLLL